jgi:RND superfamily putative drug exporter
LKKAGMAIYGQSRPGVLPTLDAIRGAPSVKPNPPPADAKVADATGPMVSQLNAAAAGAAKIADGLRLGQNEISAMLNDPVGRRALAALLINEQTVRDHPDLLRSFESYITPDGKRTRVDVAQTAQLFSSQALDQVVKLRQRLRDYLGEDEELGVQAIVAGANAQAADTRAMTRGDQIQTWFVVPFGVFVVLMFTLRDPLACVNLVATMILTYLFALGVTHLVFVTMLGAAGLDWKVPYFLFVLLVAVGVDYNVFLMARLREETGVLGLRAGISRAIAQTGGLITSAAAITAVSFASFMFSPLSSLRQLGFALVVGVTIDAVLVRPLLVPCGHWLLNRRRESRRLTALLTPAVQPLTRVSD